MFFLSRFRSPKPTFSTPLAPDSPFFAIGDLHGRNDLLHALLDRMADCDPSFPRVFVGDYIDRGEGSLEVLNHLQHLEEKSSFPVICLRGNHEEILLNFLESPARTGPSWLRSGGLQTLANLGCPPPSANASKKAWSGIRDHVADALGSGLIHWLERRPTIWTSGNVAVVHAGADPACPLDQQENETLIWGHPDFLTTPRQDGIWVVHGHTIQDVPSSSEGRIAIDTGAYATGRLTVAGISAGSVEFLTT